MDLRTADARLRIARLRDSMAALQLDAVLVPSSDPHLSEYLPAHWQGREWFSGFTGSMGTLVVTSTESALFADSRYWEQAAAELQGSGIDLVRIPTATSNLYVDWLCDHVPLGGRVAVDGRVLGLATSKLLRDALQARSIVLETGIDALQGAWEDRPPLPTAAVYEHQAPHAAVSRADKLRQVRAAMQAHGATHHFISTVDDIAWLTNLRGADVEYNPVFLAHLLLDDRRGTLYIGAGKVPADLQARLQADGLMLADYAEAPAALAALPAGSTLLLDPKRVTLGLRDAVPAPVRIVETINPSTLAKSRKTDAEAAFVRLAMEQDGAAMCAFYAWFEQALTLGERITELTVDEKISAERVRRTGFVGLSFSTIAGFNANGAMPHYRATAASHAVIEGNGLLLIDSGAQYLGGTTDITRVWPIGVLTDEQRRDCTLVLRGTMALSRARFPRGTPGPMLDSLARAPLWAEGLDFGHGTGHGVGYFLNVHEGPQSISRALPEPTMAMEAGMITSIEPGVYRPGRWGVRIENLVLNVPAATDGEFGEFLEFETLTLCPIDARCLDLKLLRDDEIDWLNRYHAEVRRRLTPHVAGDALAWLLRRTEPLQR